MFPPENMAQGDISTESGSAEHGTLGAQRSTMHLLSSYDSFLFHGLPTMMDLRYGSSFTLPVHMAAVR